MNKALIIILALLSFTIAPKALAEGGISASGGGTKTVGQTFTVTVTASGAKFDSLQGTVNISGPVDVVSFAAGSATWLPGKTPSNGGQFVGIVAETSSMAVATIKLKGKSAGSGSVSVSGAKLAYKGAVVGTGSGSTSFTIERAPDLPNSVNVNSSTHPDQNAAYEATSVTLAWNKEKGVDGFSYLQDQAANTVPPAKITSADTTVTYANQAIGTHYFHIRAKNDDGWGGTTHFKVTIKEPEAKIDETLSKPSGVTAKKAKDFINDVVNGTLSGIIISGTTEPAYTANIILDPAPTLPEGKTLSAIADADGNFELLIDFPIRSGFYKLTVQSQNDKILTPVSDPIYFEISQKAGGAVTTLTDADAEEPVPPAPPKPTPKKWHERVNWQKVSAGTGGLSVITLAGLVVSVMRLRKRKSTH